MADNHQRLTKGAKTRASILRHAADVFRQEGYYEATVASITQGLGISEGTVFQHFGSKGGLLAAVMDDFYQDLDADASDIVAAPGPAEDRFRRLIDAWALTIERDWALIREIVKVARHSPDPDLNERWKENNRRYTTHYRNLILEMQDQGTVDPEVSPSLIRDIVFGTLEMVAFGQASTGDLQVRQAAKELMDLLLLRLLVTKHDGDSALEARLDRIEAKLDSIVGARF